MKTHLELGPAATKSTKWVSKYSDEWFTVGIVRKGHVDLIQDLDKLWNLPSNQFEVAYASAVLEHMTKPVHFMKECHRVLKPGGVVRILVPHVAIYMRRYLDGMIDLKRFIRCIRDPKPRGHKQAFDPPTLKRVFRAGGFKIIHQQEPLESISDVFRGVEYFSTRPEVSIIMEGVK